MQIIQVPYDSGQMNVREGRGPGHLVERGLAAVGTITHSVETIELDGPSPIETGATFEVLKRLAGRVQSAVQRSQFPLVLAGNCISCVGTLAALGPDRTAVIWLDAHGDFNTPETTVSGLLDGMALAVAAGRCWTNMARTIPGFQPLPEENVAHVGGRDFDGDERQLLHSSDVTVITPHTIQEHGVGASLHSFLAKLKVQQVYLHIDLDVLDAKVACANQLSSGGGLTLDEVLEVIALVSERSALAAAAITAYDPEYDQDQRALAAATAIVKEIGRVTACAVREVV